MMLKNKQSPFAILTTLKLICSRPVAARYVKISGMVVDDTLYRCATNGFSHVPNCSATGGETCEKMEISTPLNSKQEVDVDIILAVFETFCHAVKQCIIIFGQVAPQ